MRDAADIRNINDLYRLLKQQQEQIDILIVNPNGGGTVVDPSDPPPMPGQAVNQARNGSFAHSVNSWAGNSNGTADADYECAYWFSHSDADDTALSMINSLSPSGRIEQIAVGSRVDMTHNFLTMGA
ncbi:MAG: hypothetical protein E6Q97_17645 [Desulfurellales bacterium]|nr:MAG: hypothetical protein E6Q97_17645 [Desulfurellales bacterium]